MISRRIFRLVSIAAMTALIGVLGCQRDIAGLDPASFPSDPEVFIDGFGPGVDFQAFGGSKVDALNIETRETNSGQSALRITVPSFGDPAGSFAGGAFVSNNGGRDLTQYNAMTFYARANRSAFINLVGFGNDNTGNSKYTATRLNIPVSGSWQKYIVPIPLSSKLEIEGGLFYFAEGPEDGEGYDLFFDDIRFETLGTLAQARPAFNTETINAMIGDEVEVTGTTYTVNAAGEDVTVEAEPGYFSFSSSDASVVSIADDGTLMAVGLGTATITASLGSTAASGELTVNVNEAPPGPSAPAPVPTQDAADVISLFSNAYTDVPVTTWSADFDQADLEDIQIAGDDVKLYTNLVFAAAEFTGPTVNASTMNRFHMDIWTPDDTAIPAVFRVKLVDFGADDAFGGGDDTEQELTFDANTTPGISTGEWVAIDLPLSAFTGLTNTSNLAQLIFSGDPNTVYVDNVYFYTDGGGGNPNEPTTPAPTPTFDAANVISLFSNAYTDVMVDTWSASFDDADLADIQISGDDVKLYTNLVFAAAEFTTQTVDASAMTHFTMDYWSPDAVAPPAVFKIKLVDFGPDNMFEGGDDTEHEIFLDATTTPSVTNGQWNTLSIPFTDFTGLTNRANLAQLIISGDPNTVYVDNVLFYAGGGGNPNEPSTPAPTPTFAASDVISLFSNAYTDVTVDTWSAIWDDADFADITVAGDDTKLYTNMVFAGIEFTSQTVDASAMTHFTMDYWSPDPTAPPAVFKIKLVDFGADGMFEGGDDTEHEIFLDETTTPSVSNGEWKTLSIPFTDFVNLTNRAHLAQLIISGDPNTVYVDNILFYR